jgi:hypothetical protein
VGENFTGGCWLAGGEKRISRSSSTTPRMNRPGQPSPSMKRKSAEAASVAVGVLANGNRASPAAGQAETQWPAELKWVVGDNFETMTPGEFQEFTAKSFEHVFDQINALQRITSKQLKTISKALVDATKPPFVYSTIIRENLCNALKVLMQDMYIKSFKEVTDSDVDFDEKNYHWSAADSDPTDPAAWPVSCMSARTPSSFCRMSHLVDCVCLCVCLCACVCVYVWFMCLVIASDGDEPDDNSDSGGQGIRSAPPRDLLR